jgi:hypothetical protein
MAGELRDREPDTGRRTPADDPDVVVEIHLADGVDGQRLRAQQARALRRVSAWLAQNSSSDGPPEQEAG